MADVKTRVETITPKMAMDWLGKSDKMLQRPVLQSRVDFIKIAIVKGTYELNGEAIIISSDDTVLDGQHRLWGVVEADTSIESVVVRGVDPSMFDTIDSTGGRSSADVLNILFKKQGGPEGSLRLAVTKMLGPAIGLVLACNRTTGEFKQFKGIGRRIHNQTVVEYVEKHPIITEQAIFMDTLPGLPGVAKSNSLCVLHLCEPHWQGVVREFITAVYSDVKHEEGSPALALRRLALQDPRPPHFIGSLSRLGFLVKAWNFWSAKHPVSMLKSNITEGFPKLRLKPDIKMSSLKPSKTKAKAAEVEAKKDLPRNALGGVQRGVLKALKEPGWVSEEKSKPKVRAVPLPPTGLKGGLTR